MNKVLHIHPQDNVLVALADLKAGEFIQHHGHRIPVKTDVAAKHKIALTDFGFDQPVIMYGVLIGKTQTPIPSGYPITTQNVKHASGDFGLRTADFKWHAPDVTQWRGKTFKGYHRSDGQVGLRNYWLIVPLVFCENRNINTLKDAFVAELGYGQPDRYRSQVKQLVESYRKHGAIAEIKFEGEFTHLKSEKTFPHVDGIKFITHDTGCGGTREDSNNLCALLAGYFLNPNVGGMTVLSLGCQHAQIDLMKEAVIQKAPSDKPLLFFEQQGLNTEEELLRTAINETFSGIAEINKQERKPATLDHLCIGVECGGSDGFSGISANPAMGHTADIVCALGGKVILSEFPELCGVEQELINRCVSDEVAEKFIKLMREYARRAEASGSGFDMNPSPGNIKDGLITDAMKSAGAAKKGGTSPVSDVLGYGEYATRPGLNLLCTPGNDVESTSGLASAGANVQLFSTGLGTPTGNPISPVVKISTTTSLAKRMHDIIDIDAGGIISGEKTLEQTGEEILDYIVRMGSGEFDTKAMILGQDDFIFWKRGVSL